MGVWGSGCRCFQSPFSPLDGNRKWSNLTNLVFKAQPLLSQQQIRYFPFVYFEIGQTPNINRHWWLCGHFQHANANPHILSSKLVHRKCFWTKFSPSQPTPFLNKHFRHTKYKHHYGKCLQVRTRSRKKSVSSWVCPLGLLFQLLPFCELSNSIFV